MRAHHGRGFLLTCLNLHTLNTSAILFVHPDASGTVADIAEIPSANKCAPSSVFLCLLLFGGCYVGSRERRCLGYRYVNHVTPATIRLTSFVAGSPIKPRTAPMCTATEPTSADDRHELKLYLANIHKLLISDQEGARVEQNTAIATQLLELVIDRLEVAA